MANNQDSPTNKCLQLGRFHNFIMGWGKSHSLLRSVRKKLEHSSSEARGYQKGKEQTYRILHRPLCINFTRSSGGPSGLRSGGMVTTPSPLEEAEHRVSCRTISQHKQNMETNLILIVCLGFRVRDPGVPRKTVRSLFK